MRAEVSRVVVVTGAASGLGRSLTIEFAREGCRLAVCDVSAAALEETVDLAVAAGAAATLAANVDVTRFDDVERFARRVDERFGEAQVLVNNAGRTLHGNFVDVPIEEIEDLVRVNLIGPLNLCKAFVPLMMASAPRGGSRRVVVNIASVLGLVGVPTRTVYCATKFGVRGFSAALRSELAEHDIDVSIIYVGGMNTKLFARARAFGTAGSQAQVTMLERCAAGSLADPDDVAREILKHVAQGGRNILMRRNRGRPLPPRLDEIDFTVPRA